MIRFRERPRAGTGALRAALAAWMLSATFLQPAHPLRAQTPARMVELRPGLVVTRSVTIRPGSYRLPAGDSGVIRIRGDDVVVDFNGAELVGADPGAAPDGFAGTAVVVEGGRNVTLRNARIRGYKVAVLARGTRNLVVESSELGHNWKPRLHSHVEHESLVDWLYFHRNEHDEWLRYGAAIYLDGVEGGEIRGNTARQGMNGLMLVRTNGVRVWNNDFSYLSGVGIGMYRASRNRIMHNRVDYAVRGYSHGFYNRGQDSAALLMYEQCRDNVVAYNSMTHGGDGLFLWAGQETMDDGSGGSNDNLFYGNDFSHAPTNGMEATFSRNVFANNRVEESWHGLWGGYSWESQVLGNRFGRNQEAIAIEHGQDNRIEYNVFDGDTTAIRLWWNPIEPSDWGYPRHRDTRSRDYLIRGNRFRGNRVALRVDATQDVRVTGNGFFGVDTLLAAKGDTAGWRFEHNRVDSATAWTPRGDALPDAVRRLAPEPIPGGMDPMIPAGGRRGRETIIVDQWGPYDWRSPKLWPAGSPDSLPLRLRVLGPPGRWRVTGMRGVERISATEGSIPALLTVTPAAGANTDVALELEYRGAEVVAPDGARTPAGSPYRFGWSRFVAPAGWRVRVVAWDDATDPRPDTTAADRAAADSAADARFRRALAGTPLVQRELPVLDWMWYRPKVDGVPQQRWALEAAGTVTLPEGRSWLLRTISDDGIRVWVDGRLAVDAWAPHESAVHTAQIAPGRHDLRVEYYQVDGWVELRAEVVPAD